MIGSRRRNRRLTFDDAHDIVEADVAHHATAYTPTEHIPAVQDAPTLVADPDPADAEVAPEPEPEVLPEAGYVVLPTLYSRWPHLFGQVPALLGEDTPQDALRYGWVDVSIATRDVVEEFLGCDLVSWVGKDAVVRGPVGDLVTAHDGDRILRDEDGLHVQCARAFPDWETGTFTAVDAAIAAGEAG